MADTDCAPDAEALDDLLGRTVDVPALLLLGATDCGCCCGVRARRPPAACW